MPKVFSMSRCKRVRSSSALEARNCAASSVRAPAGAPPPATPGSGRSVLRIQVYNVEESTPIWEAYLFALNPLLRQVATLRLLRIDGHELSPKEGINDDKEEISRGNAPALRRSV